MKRVAFLLLGFLAVAAAIAVTVAFTRPIKWPASIGSPELRQALGEEAEPVIDESTEEAAA